MWWMLQIVGAIGVCGAQMCNRYYNVGITSWVIYSFIAIFITYPSFGKSFAIAPSFFSAWFVGLIALSVIGLLGSLLVFKESISIQQWIGCILSVPVAYLLIK